MAADLKGLKTQFLEYIEIEKGRSVKTVENYDRYLMRFLNFAKVKSPAEISEQSVREFRITLNRSAGVTGTMKKNTQNYHLIALRAFLKFLRKRDIESLNPERIELAKTSGRDLDLITADELNRIMKAPARFSNFYSLRVCVSRNCAGSIKTWTSRAMNSRYAAREKKCASYFSPRRQKKRSQNI